MGNPLKVWLGPARAPFLLLAVVLVLVGGGLARADGVFSWTPFLLCLGGAVLVHASVNIFNELSDHRTRIDFNTRRTPFSGGSGTLQAGLLSEKQVRAGAWTTLGTAAAIGVYLTARSGWELLLFLVPGGLATVFYTSHLARFALGELAAGACLGSFVVMGTYFAVTGTITSTAALISIPPGILTSLLLFLNEFPDLEADRAGGRKHLLILLGRRKASVVYAASLAACYLFLVAGVMTKAFSPWVLMSLLTLPLAFKAAATTLRHHEDFAKMVPALGANVGVVLGTDLLLAVAFFIQ